MGNLNSKSTVNDGKWQEKPINIRDYFKLCFSRKKRDVVSVESIECGVKKLSVKDASVSDNQIKDDGIILDSVSTSCQSAREDLEDSDSEREDTPELVCVKVDADPRNERHNSDISEDSGFNESVNKPKEKKLQTFVVPRGPDRHHCAKSKPHPYNGEQAPHSNQISQIHEQIFSGGQVFVNTEPSLDEASNIINLTILPELDPATLNDDFNLLCEYIAEDMYKYPEDRLISCISNAIDESCLTLDPNEMSEFDNIILENPTLPSVFAPDSINADSVGLELYAPPTPPTSEGFSPMSRELMNDQYDSTSSDNGLFSPLLQELSPYDSLSPFLPSDPDLLSSSPELCQDIPESIQSPDLNSPELIKEKGKSLTQYKKEQTELLKDFKQLYCCKTKEPSKKFFQERLNAMESTERRLLCQKIASMNFAGANKVLQDILSNIATESDDTNLLILVFGLIFHRIITVKPADFFLSLAYNLVRTAALECFKFPIITQFLSETVRSVTQAAEHPSTAKAIFEKESIGDNLVAECVRKGEDCLKVLYWLVRKEPNMLPLLDVDQPTTEGYTALHVACQLHSEAKPLKNTVHVLMYHGAANIFKKEDKAGDTPLHLAVSSNSCDPQVVMTIFSHVPQNKWFELTRCTNNANISPHKLSSQLLKSHSNSSSHPNDYVKNLADIDNFFKRCRKDMGKA